MTTYRTATIYELSTDTLTGLLSIYHQHYRHLPRGLTVNPATGDRLRELLTQTGHNIPVYTTGGCLLGEIWLDTAPPKEKCHA